MYTIISATNREGSNTLKVSKEYQRFFKEHGIETTIFSLEDYTSLKRDEAFLKLEKEILTPTTKFIFIMPEYNGSFPGIFKLMMDNSDLSVCWNYKKVMLVGVAAGRSGNLRGIDIMTNMCHYMKMNVFHSKLPLSSILKEMPEGVFINEGTVKEINTQIEGYIKF